MSSSVARRLALPLAAFTALAATAVLSGTAGAAPSVIAGAPTVTGVATAPTGTSPDVTLTYTITVSGAPLVDAILVAAQPATLPADPDSVRVDGTAPATGAAFVAGDQLTVGLGEGAGPSSGGLLAPGMHTVSFTADASTAVNGSVDKASLAYTEGETPSGVTAADVPILLPDLEVTTPDGSGEDKTLPLSYGDDGDFGVEVRNLGATADATLTITVPPGLTVDEDYGVSRGEDEDEVLDCSDAGPSTVTCDLGRVTSRTQLIFIPVTPAENAPIGQVATFTVSALATSGVDGNRADNAVNGSVRFAGSSHLKITLTPATQHVAVGDSTTVRAVVSNQGAEAAGGTVALLAVLTREGRPSTKTFQITGFTGRQIDLGGLGDPESGGSSSEPIIDSARTVARSHALREAFSRGSVLSTAKDGSTDPVLAWDVATLASGKSVSATLTLKAEHVGSAYVVGIALADNDNSCESEESTECDSLQRIRIDAVVAKAAPAGGSSTPVATGGVANTGTPTGQLTLLGLLALLLGTVLARAGVIRHHGRHRAVRRI